LKGRSDEAFYGFPVMPGSSRMRHGGGNDFRYGSGFAKGWRLDAEEVTPSGISRRRIIGSGKSVAGCDAKNNDLDRRLIFPDFVGERQFQAPGLWFIQSK
jgi:hypothetical protein